MNADRHSASESVFEALPMLADVPPRPRKFRPAERVLSAHIAELQVLPVPKLRGARRAGIVFERKVQAQLRTWYPELRASPWLRFATPSGSRLCQPDAILVRRNLAGGPAPLSVVIFEVKLRHCIEAYWQLRELYLPVVRCLHPAASFRLVEVCRHFDPDVRFPCPSVYVNELEAYLSAPYLDDTSIGIFQWKP